MKDSALYVFPPLLLDGGSFYEDDSFGGKVVPADIRRTINRLSIDFNVTVLFLPENKSFFSKVISKFQKTLPDRVSLGKEVVLESVDWLQYAKSNNSPVFYLGNPTVRLLQYSVEFLPSIEWVKNTTYNFSIGDMEINRPMISEMRKRYNKKVSNSQHVSKFEKKFF